MIPWWLVLCCGAPALEPDVSEEQLLAALEAMTRQAPSRAYVAGALDLELLPVGSTEYTVEYQGSVPHFPEVSVVEATGGGTSAPRVRLTVAGPCVSFEQVKARFGFAHAAVRHPGAPEPSGERYVHPLPTGRLTAAYVQGCLREVWFEGQDRASTPPPIPPGTE